MPAATVDLTIEQGSEFAHRFTVQAFNSAGCTARMQIRETIDSPVVCELTTENGRIAMTQASADTNLDLSIATAITAAFKFTKAVYDLEIVPSSGKVFRLVQGKVKVSPEVTR